MSSPEIRTGGQDSNPLAEYMAFANGAQASIPVPIIRRIGFVIGLVIARNEG